MESADGPFCPAIKFFAAIPFSVLSFPAVRLAGEFLYLCFPPRIFAVPLVSVSRLLGFSPVLPRENGEGLRLRRGETSGRRWRGSREDSGRQKNEMIELCLIAACCSSSINRTRLSAALLFRPTLASPTGILSRALPNFTNVPPSREDHESPCIPRLSLCFTQFHRFYFYFIFFPIHDEKKAKYNTVDHFFVDHSCRRGRSDKSLLIIVINNFNDDNCRTLSV